VYKERIGVSAIDLRGYRSYEKSEDSLCYH